MREELWREALRSDGLSMGTERSGDYYNETSNGTDGMERPVSLYYSAAIDHGLAFVHVYGRRRGGWGVPLGRALHEGIPPVLGECGSGGVV